jgi:molybdopterin-guanine dinucleotide biosynthesis protein A
MENTVSPIDFSAVLLAGGRSTRMGRDKAALIFAGQRLWCRQLALLQSLGASQVLISGPLDGAYGDSGVQIIPDAEPGLGPLAGVAATMKQISTPFLLVLAIDLPAMSAEFLARLVREAIEKNTGIVPEHDGRFEPLAAIYPTESRSLIERLLRGERRSLQNFVRCAIEQSLARSLAISEEDLMLFRNVNRPEDL